MKKIISIPTFLIFLLLITQSCTKQSRDEMGKITMLPGQSINAAVSPGNPYILNVSNLGSVTILKQAAYFAISQTETDPKDGMLLYKYIPLNNYTGADEVVLSTSKTSYSSGNGCMGGGGRTDTYNSNIVIKFTVTK